MANTENGIVRWALMASALFFALYLANVLIGKASALMGASEPMSVGDLPEFLTLLAATICFVIGTLSKERQAKSDALNRPPSQDELNVREGEKNV